jgi:hypothetical protein
MPVYGPEPKANIDWNQLIDAVLGPAAPPSKYDSETPPYKYPGTRSSQELAAWGQPETSLKDTGKNILSSIVEGMGSPDSMVNPLVGVERGLAGAIPALIKGGRIAPDLVPKAAPGAKSVRAFQGSARALADPRLLELEGKAISETPAEWSGAVQTFYPKNSPQEIRTWGFKDPVPREFGDTGHFSHMHARKVQTDRPVDFWEEIQSEFKHDKAPSSAVLNPRAHNSEMDALGIPTRFDSPWATSDTSSRGSFDPTLNSIRERMADSFDYGHQRTTSESRPYLGPNHNVNIMSQLDATTKAKLFELPDWVRGYVDDYIHTWERGPSNRTRNLDQMANKFLERYAADTSLSPERKNTLYNSLHPISTTSFQFQSGTHELTTYELSRWLKPTGRIDNFVDQMYGVFQKLKGGPTPSVDPKLITTFPEYGRQRQAEFMIDRLMNEADASGRVFTMADIAGSLMRQGKPLSYGYKDAPKKMGLVPEMLRLTTRDPQVAGHSYGPRSLSNYLKQTDGMEPRFQDILKSGGQVTNIYPPLGRKSVHAYDIPVWTRPQDIELAKSMGIHQKSDPRPDRFRDIQRYNEWNEQRESEHVSQLLDRILNSKDNPLDVAGNLDVDLPNIARRLGGVRREFSNNEIQTLIRELSSGNMESVTRNMYNVPWDVQARMLAEYDPIAAFSRLNRR